MDSDDSAPRHPIRVVAQRTGLTLATIRAWERRYDAVRPARSDGGQRLYSDHDVTRLLNLRQLTEAGRQISMVAGLQDEAVLALLREDRAALATAGSPVAPVEPGGHVNQAFAQILAFDDSGLEYTLWRAAMSLGANRFVDDVVGPLLTRVGAAWEAGELSPGQEHLGSEIVDRVIERLTEPSRSLEGPRLIVATLPGERHGLGARLVSTCASLEGWSVTYLGTDLPEAEIVGAAVAVDAAAVAISAVSRDDLEKTIGSLTAVRESLDPSVELLLGGGAATALGSKGLPHGVTLLEGLASFREWSQNGHAPRTLSTRVSAR